MAFLQVLCIDESVNLPFDTSKTKKNYHFFFSSLVYLYLLNVRILFLNTQTIQQQNIKLNVR